MSSRPIRLAAVAVLIALSGAGAAADSVADTGAGRQFVRRHGRELEANGARFRVAGSNNYYLMYKSVFMVDDVLGAAVAAGFNTLRIWGSLDIGNQDDSNSIRGKADGVYFHFWNGTAPAFNDGADGLEHLHYVLYRAGQLNLRVIIPLVNNWNDFGGMDQYVRWRGGQFHDDFYTDPLIRTWYEEWIAHLVNRVNVYTGVAYKDDPTIMKWELAN
jgi:mannan endo-1,4-beta-mannosidase